MKTAAAYIRVSTEDQTEYSPASQLEKICEYAKRNDYIIPDEYIYVDEGISGRHTQKRTGFNSMISTAKQKPKPFDAILLWKFSRFARNREDSIVYKSMLRKQCGIDVISVSENIGDNKMSVGFIQDGAFHSVRSMNGGSLNVIINKLSSSLDISAEKCHEMFEKNDLKVVEGVAISVLEDAMKVAFEELMSQITFGIRYHSSAEDSRPLERILIGGGGASVPGLLEYIAEKTGIETATVNPFRSVECDSSVVDKEGMSVALSNIYAPALGLAMRKF